MSRKRASWRRNNLKDNAWGIGLGIVLILFIGAAFFGGRITGANGAATCDKALGPLPGGTNITAQGFQDEDTSLEGVIDLLRAGDRSGADAKFYGPVHSFMHNADPVLRAVNVGAARSLCQSVIQLEKDLVGSTQNIDLANDISAVREDLRNAAVTLGYPRPGGGQ